MYREFLAFQIGTMTKLVDRQAVISNTTYCAFELYPVNSREPAGHSSKAYKLVSMWPPV